MIYLWKHADWQDHLLGLLQGFAELADACITICSLAFFASGFEFKVSKYRALSRIKRMKRMTQHKL